MEHLSKEFKKRRVPNTSDHHLMTVLLAGFRRSNDVMFYCNAKGVILDINEAFSAHYGYTREEAIGKTPAILRSHHSSEELYQAMWRSILDPRKGYWRGELVNRAKDGREVPLILTITAVRNDDDSILGYISNGVDLTETKALEERVAHAETLAVIGEMAAVVAHEIRNPLGSIVMAAQQLADESLPREDRDTVTRVLRLESKRLNEALSNFLSYARPRPLNRERGDLNALLTEVARLAFANKDQAGGARLTLTLDRALEPFPFDADQVRQVVWNMVINAVQALAGKGTVAVRSGQGGGFAWFSVADTGPGIPEEMGADLFKPFRTTKQQGTGLGLAIADRIVNAHGGRIELETRPARGTTFTVRLPRVEG
ncbi:MAG TPA: ATP-binding protein [Elusimicrobiota bacterium]|jgi:two-component system sensor histidine kinase PilS (NtrC family)|nr:ATP-binding protein [Elusimicrobiota bacterium]